MKHCYRCGFISDDIHIYIVAPKTIEHLCLECSKKLEKIKNGTPTHRNRISSTVAKGAAGSVRSGRGSEA